MELVEFYEMWFKFIIRKVHNLSNYRVVLRKIVTKKNEEMINGL